MRALRSLSLLSSMPAVVGVAIGNRERIIEAAVEEPFAVDHGPFIPLRHELIHHRSLHGRHVTVLDQVFVAEGLLELADLELELVPIMDVHVGIGDRLVCRRSGEIGQQAKLVIVRTWWPRCQAVRGG